MAPYYHFNRGVHNRFIAKRKMENMSPEEVAQNHREQVAGTCDNLDNLTKNLGFVMGLIWIQKNVS